MNSEFFQNKMLISEGLTSNNYLFLQRNSEKGIRKIESKKPFPTTTFCDEYASKLND